MSSNKIELNAESTKQLGKKLLAGFVRYAAILFFVLVAIAYGFVVLRINMLASSQPSQSEIDAQTTSTPVPRIDPKVAEQLQQLQDNSVNVQSLFQEARNNPFQ